jgi:phosphatidylinositol-3-phosphatase
MTLSSRAAGAALALLGLAACGSTGPTPPVASPTPGPAARTAHVFVTVLENHEYDAVVGTGAMPYLDTLIARYGLAAAYFANTHPSIGNYFMMTTGTIPTNDDHYSGTVSDDNVVRALNAAGLSWKAYAQSIPSAGYLGPDRGPYARNHVPFALLSDVVDDPAQAGHIVPLESLAADIAADTLPSYGFVVPDTQHSGHSCPAGRSGCSDAEKLAAADAWLRTAIGPLIDSPAFRSSGLLFITFDEGDFSDKRNGGGHVATVVVSAKTPSHAMSGTFYRHESLLATAMRALGVRAPGAAAGAPSMSDLFAP